MHRGLIKAAITGAAMPLLTELPCRDTMRAAELPDPTPAAMTAALVRRGYNPAEAAHMVQVCGTRPRLLDVPRHGEWLPPAAAVEADAVMKARRDIERLGTKRGVPPAKVFDLLERVERAHAGGEHVVATAAFIDRRVITGRAGLLFVDGAGHVWFDSDIVRRAWAAERASYTERQPE